VPRHPKSVRNYIHRCNVEWPLTLTGSDLALFEKPNKEQTHYAAA
jgi:hypothetical protein